MQCVYACRMHKDVNGILGDKINKREAIIKRLALALFASVDLLNMNYASGFLCDLERATLSTRMHTTERFHLLGKIGSCIYYEDQRRIRAGRAKSYMMFIFIDGLIKKKICSMQGCKAYYVPPSVAKNMLDHLYSSV